LARGIASSSDLLLARATKPLNSPQYQRAKKTRVCSLAAEKLAQSAWTEEKPHFSCEKAAE